MTSESTPGDDWHTYRCPVCGHTDGVAMAGAPEATLRCSHCDTPLRVERRESLALKVTVADETPRRRQREGAS